MASIRQTIIRRAALAALVVPSLFLGSWIAPVGAQLSRCTLQQQLQHSPRCERPGISSSSSLETVPGLAGPDQPNTAGGNITGLPDLGKPRHHRAPMDSFDEPMMPPMDGVRDYLNRLDPPHATQPIQPIPPPPPLLGGNR